MSWTRIRSHSPGISVEDALGARGAWIPWGCPSPGSALSSPPCGPRRGHSPHSAIKHLSHLLHDLQALWDPPLSGVPDSAPEARLVLTFPGRSGARLQVLCTCWQPSLSCERSSGLEGTSRVRGRRPRTIRRPSPPSAAGGQSGAREGLRLGAARRWGRGLHSSPWGRHPGPWRLHQDTAGDPEPPEAVGFARKHIGPAHRASPAPGTPIQRFQGMTEHI